MAGPAPVTVVIPAFNAALTLDAALASVVGQSVLPERVIVADDHSADGSHEVAGNWRPFLPLDVVRLEHNSGPAAARRAAIDRSESTLIALLDADDIWLPDHLASLMHAQQDHDGIVCADALRWYPNQTVRGTTHRARHPIPPPHRQLLEIVRKNFVSIGSMFPRSAYERVGGFRDGFSGAEDWDLWIRMIRKGLTVRGSDGPTLLYRVANTGLSHSIGIFDVYVRVLEAAKQEARNESERGEAIKGLRWMRARREVAIAHREARDGHPGAARAAAARSLSGPIRFAIEGGLLLASPALGVRIGDAIRNWRR